MRPERGRRLAFPFLVALLLMALWALTGYQAYSEREQVIAAKEVDLRRLATAVKEQTLRLFKLTEASLLRIT